VSVTVAIQVVIVLLMVVVGLDLTTADFRRIAEHPRAIIVGTVGQLVTLPLVVLALVATLHPAPFLVAGMIVVAACPGGALSNLYVYLARANTALSVSLTAVATLLSIVTLPLLTAAGFELLLGERMAGQVPPLVVMRQLLFLLLAPLGAGMLLRHRHPEVSRRYGPRLRQLSIVAIVALIVFVIYDQRRVFAESLGAVTVAAVAFTGLSMAAGMVVAWIGRLDAADRFAFLAEFSIRNLAIAAIVAVTVLGRLDFLVFATAFFLTQVPIMLLAIAVYRATQGRGAGLNVTRREVA